MYASFFNFREDPFGVSPDLRYFFPSAQHAEASAALYYAITQRRGFAVLLAPPGLGKTSTLVHFADRIAQQARVAFFVHPPLVDGCVLESVLHAVGVEPASEPAARFRQLHEFLLELERHGNTCVVVLDEAQNLTRGSLETIRMLSNFETTTHKLIQFVLAGQPELAQLLSTPECEQIRQRINVVARLEPLSPSQVHDYIAHRLNAIAAPGNPFTAAAIGQIARLSAGVPRNVNTLCFTALTSAFALGKTCVDADDILRAHHTLALDRLEETSPHTIADPKPSPDVSILLNSNGAPSPALRPFLLAAATALLAVACAGTTFLIN